MRRQCYFHFCVNKMTIDLSHCECVCMNKCQGLNSLNRVSMTLAEDQFLTDAIITE